MPVCVRCGKEVGLLGSVTFNKRTGRCSSCEKLTKQALDRFRQAFLSFSQDGVISPDEWARLGLGASREFLDINEALSYIRGDALNLLERTLAFASADGYITDEEEQNIHHLRVALAIPDSVAKPVLDRLAYLKALTNIRRGILPTVHPSVRLESDEICHLEIEATYHKVNAKSISFVPGRLIATNKKLHFLSAYGGAQIGWKTVMRVETQPGGVYLELSKKSANGHYAVADPVWVEAVLDTLVRIAKRELLMPIEGVNSRRIPQEVKMAVWQRDQGKCVQCGATDYLEFDHIIPFSKGGASTVNNVQILCRRCNLTKGDRI